MLIKKITKLFLGFGLSLLLAWLTKSYFAQLYVWVEKPKEFTGLIMYKTSHYPEGFLIALSLFFSVYSFLLKQHWKFFLVLFLPLILFSLYATLWNLFIWYAAMFVVGWLFAQVILFIFKIFEK